MSAFVSCILFPYPFPCPDPFSSPRLRHYHAHTAVKLTPSCLSWASICAQKAARVHCLFTRKSSSIQKPRQGGSFPSSPVTATFQSATWIRFFVTKAVAISMYEGSLLPSRRHPEPSRNPLWNFFVAKIRYTFSPKPAFASYRFWGVSEMSSFPSLITNKNNGLQMLTLK